MYLGATSKKKDRQATNRTFKIAKHACNLMLQIVEIMVTKQK